LLLNYRAALIASALSEISCREDCEHREKMVYGHVHVPSVARTTHRGHMSDLRCDCFCCVIRAMTDRIPD
jgi:hypothetical protein